MNDPTTAALPHEKPSRRLAVYASLWLAAAWLDNGSYAALTLQTLFASLTLGAILFAMVKETRTLRLRGMTFTAGLYIVCWAIVILPTVLRPFCMNLVAALADT